MVCPYNTVELFFVDGGTGDSLTFTEVCFYFSAYL